MVEVSSRALPRQFHEPGSERYSGEAVLADYEAREPIVPAEARSIMTRFLAAQYLTNRLRGDWSTRLLRLQRSAALNALGTGLLLEREQRLLRRALELDDPEGEWRGDVIGLLAAAAGQAHECGHSGGAGALGRIVYEAAWAARDWPQAAAAAERLGAWLAAEDTSGRALWQRRATALRRRARRAARAAAAGAAAGAAAAGSATRPAGAPQ